MQIEHSMIILPKWLIKSARETPIKHCGVRISGYRISDIGNNHDLLRRYPDDIVVEALDDVLAPGFVNTHTHLYGVLAHGIPLTKAPSGFWPFLTEFWWPLVENRLDQDMICTTSELRCVDMLKSGVTTFYDCTEAPYALPGCLETQAQRIKIYGIRAILSFEASERISSENGRL
ncbi:MAG: amidohydrolase family protein, partial [Anaerolineaceae bacterium]|nr:amidohydrolase family protein [Anaerolineaceae bacterium]